MLQYTLEWQAAGQARRARLDVPGSAGELSGGELSALSSAGDQQRVAVRRSAGGSWTQIFLLSSGRPGIVQLYSDQSGEAFDWSDAPTLNALADDILERGDEAMGRRALSRRRGQLSEGARAILREAGRPIPEPAERNAGE